MRIREVGVDGSSRKYGSKINKKRQPVDWARLTYKRKGFEILGQVNPLSFLGEISENVLYWSILSVSYGPQPKNRFGQTRLKLGK